MRNCLSWLGLVVGVCLGVTGVCGGGISGGTYSGTIGAIGVVGLVIFLLGIFGLIAGAAEGRSVPGGTLSALPNEEAKEDREVNLEHATALGRDGLGVVAVDDVSRQSGCYVIGVQGVGKSSLLEQMINQDIKKGQSVIVLDPHGDLIDHALAQMPRERVKDAYLLSIEDIKFPFGLNLFTVREGADEIEETQALDRVLHVFEKCFPETSRMLLEKYLGNITPVFFSNAGAGYGMTDIPTFLQDDDFRAGLVKKSRLFIRKFWEGDFAAMSPSVRRSETGSLSTRLNRFMRSPIVGNIIGQSSTTIDFRRAIENKEIIFIKLPVKTLKDDATLIGTMLVAQLHAAIFSFADTLLENRPTFSLYVDEFQHFCSSDFAEMFTEGRKFGVRVTVAHQFRGQLPDYLASASMTARTKIAFQTTQEDAPKLAPLFTGQEVKGRSDVSSKACRELGKWAVDNNYWEADNFVSIYLRQMREQRKGGKVEYWRRDYGVGDRFWARDGLRTYGNPEPVLDDLFYRVQKYGDYKLPIPYDAIWGFVGCSKGYWQVLEKASDETKRNLASADLLFPADIRQWGAPETEWQELYRFLYFLRRTMIYLALNPIAEGKTMGSSEVAGQILKLPRRHAMVRAGDVVSEVETLDIPSSVKGDELQGRKDEIVRRTRAKYCRPAKEVEKEIEKRLGIIEDVVSDGVSALDVEEQKPDTGKPSDNGDGGGEKKRRRISEVDDE